MRPSVWLTPGELSARSGVAVSALHYYEARGLIDSRRTSGNRRTYRRDTLRRLAFIRVAQGVGVSLDEIREALDSLPDSRVPTAADWARLSRQWHDRLTERIEALTALRDSFTDCIGCGCLSMASCPLANPGDVLGAQGPGPHRLGRSVPR
ncbi:redox-sensitive transcriptional activator SoxR [Rhodococcus sp. 2H158]|nr:transcriptional regulator [Rhodococcus rhodochrous]